MEIKSIAAIAAFSVAVSAFAAPTVYEAEAQPGVNAGDVSADSTGAKFVTKSSGTEFTFTVNVEETAMYDITTKVLIKQYDWTTSKILVNGVEAGSMLTTPRNCDSSYVVAASAKMRTGENTITVGNGAIGVDYITVERHPDPVFNISALPVTPNASESAKKVKTFLRDNFMKKTVSGMMISDQNFNYDYGNMKLLKAGECTPADSCKFSDEEVSWKGQTDIAEFYKRSGHYPAVGGFDMLFAAGGHHEEGWFRGYTENNLVMTEQLWELGGIPTYTWHWKVGEDTIFYTQQEGYRNAGCTEGVTKTADNNTCFNYTKAFKDSTCKEIDATSQVYKDIVADVDIVSGYFKELEEKGIAVVWRPLHEASGGWFWWGTASPECYVQLYRLVFDRMVNTNKLTNLIWVWNINTDPKFGYDYGGLGLVHAESEKHGILVCRCGERQLDVLLPHARIAVAGCARNLRKIDDALIRKRAPACCADDRLHAIGCTRIACADAAAMRRRIGIGCMTDIRKLAILKYAVVVLIRAAHVPGRAVLPHVTVRAPRRNRQRRDRQRPSDQATPCLSRKGVHAPRCFAVCPSGCVESAFCLHDFSSLLSCVSNC